MGKLLWKILQISHVSVLRNVERYLIRWVMRKYKRFQRHKHRARDWLGRVRKREPGLFVHWRLDLDHRLDNGSCMSGDVQYILRAALGEDPDADLPQHLCA